MTYSAKVIEDSVTALGDEQVRLTTLEVTFPRFILAEFNTHRVFSRNSASSRAIPVERRIAQIRENPFVPEAFTVNKRGMQADVTLDERDNSKARDVWLRACEAALKEADALVDLGVHKQHANRLLEPFAWHTVVCTATEWTNFFNLRTDKNAQPEMQITAKLMREAYEASSPVFCLEGAWHLPYVADRKAPIGEQLIRSVTSCAAVSYERQSAEAKPLADLEARYSMFISSGHWSPLEHQAVVGSGVHGLCGNFRRPWMQYRKTFDGEDVWRAKD